MRLRLRLDCEHQAIIETRDAEISSRIYKREFVIKCTFDHESRKWSTIIVAHEHTDFVNLRVRSYRLNSVSSTWKVCTRCSHAHSCAGTNQGFDRSCNRNCNFAFASAICLRLTSAIIAVLAVLGLVPFQALPSAVSGWICVRRTWARTCVQAFAIAS